jgi:periplasmic divalent cation tolerance protein
MSKAIVVLTTIDSREAGERLAHALVDRKAAACVQVLHGMTSVYRWKENVETAAEVLLLIKTMEEGFERVEAIIHELHTYETPEILSLAVENGSGEYLEWLQRSILC